MLSKHRTRILAVLGIAAAIVATPQLAEAGSGTGRADVRPNGPGAGAHGARRASRASRAPSPSPPPPPSPPSPPSPRPSSADDHDPPGDSRTQAGTRSRACTHSAPGSHPDAGPGPHAHSDTRCRPRRRSRCRRPCRSPVPTPPPAASDCVTQSPRATVSGVQRDRYRPSPSSHLAVDARGASWTQVDDWPVSIEGRGSLCWDGGTIAGTWGPSTVWETFHHTGGFSFANPDSVVENVRVAELRRRHQRARRCVGLDRPWCAHLDDPRRLSPGRLPERRPHRRLAVRRLLRGHLDPRVVEQLELGRSRQHRDHAELAAAAPADADRVQGSGAGARWVLQVGRRRAPVPEARARSATCSGSTSSRTTARSASPTAIRWPARTTPSCGSVAAPSRRRRRGSPSAPTRESSPPAPRGTTRWRRGTPRTSRTPVRLRVRARCAHP